MLAQELAAYFWGCFIIAVIGYISAETAPVYAVFTYLLLAAVFSAYRVGKVAR